MSRRPQAAAPVDSIRTLLTRFLEQHPGSFQTDLAMVLQGTKPTTDYQRRQGASARLSNALRGEERVSRYRWGTWLERARRHGINTSGLEMEEVVDLAEAPPPT